MNTKERLLLLKQKLLTYRVTLWVYLLSSFVFFLHNLLQKDYNNYRIFSSAFLLLKNHENLYVLHPQYAWDYYRYTPSFAVLIAPFSFLPEWLGVNLWNLLNALVLWLGVRSLFREDEKKGALVLWIILIELITAIQNCQANALVAGIMLLSFSSFRENKTVTASFLTLLNLFIKIYGFATAAVFLLRPKKIKFILSSVLFFAALFCLPLIYLSWDELKQEYVSEFQNVTGYTAGLSIMSLVSAWFNIRFPFLWVQVPALILLLIPALVPASRSSERLQLLFFCSILMFLVSFNQMAESPTYIIGVTGAAIWFVQAEKNKLNLSLFTLLMFFTCLAPTDLYPRYLRDHFFVPYKIKALPLFLVWVKVQVEIWGTIRKNPTRVAPEN